MVRDIHIHAAHVGVLYQVQPTIRNRGSDGVYGNLAPKSHALTANVLLNTAAPGYN